MTTPASYNTAASIIRAAMVEATLLQKGQEPDSEDFAVGMNILTDLIGLWQTQGIKLFLIQNVAVTLVAGQGMYTISPSGNVNMPRPLEVYEAYFLDQNAVQRPLIPLSWNEYSTLSRVSQQGAVNSFFVDKQASVMNIHLWLVPDATTALGTVHLILKTSAIGPTLLTDSTLFPPEWAIALRWGLADELCTGAPQGVADRCEKRAAAYRQALEDQDTEATSTFLQPDSRGGYNYHEFL